MGQVVSFFEGPSFAEEIMSADFELKSHIRDQQKTLSRHEHQKKQCLEQLQQQLIKNGGSLVDSSRTLVRQISMEMKTCQKLSTTLASLQGTPLPQTASALRSGQGCRRAW
jgi:hypothetical protein